MLARLLTRRYAGGARRSYNTITASPEPSCTCRSMPPGLDIDQSKPLNGTVPAYTEQVLLFTGKSDWTSRMEDDDTAGLGRRLKSLLGPKGKYFDPYRNIILTASSFASSAGAHKTQRHLSDSAVPSTTVCLLPSFVLVPDVSVDDQSATDLIQHFLPQQKEQYAERNNDLITRAKQVSQVVVLICSHGTRDSRCGILGPLLQDEFIDQLDRAGHSVTPSFDMVIKDEPGEQRTVVVGLISHIGGHRWAGNVIIYVPPTLDHPLAGRGVWYGRVAPNHVEGIVRETILQGKVIQELFRGGIEPDRQPMRISTP